MIIERKFILAALCLVFIGCTSPMSTKEIRNTAYQCDNIDRKISTLKNEKMYNSRVLSGARSIIPFGVIAGIIQLNYFDHLSVAAGRQGKVIDKKISEMGKYESECA